MVAPTALGAQAAYSGLTFGDLVEAALNRRGLTKDTASTAFTQATAAEIANTKRYVKDGLQYLQRVRHRWWPVREATTGPAEASGSTYPSLDTPADLGVLIDVTIGGLSVRMLDTEQYAANIVSDADGGGILQTSGSGDPYYGRLVVKDVAVTAAPALALFLYPVQTAAWSAKWYYRATARNLSDYAETILLPVEMHPMLELYVEYAWRLASNDPSGAASFWTLLTARLDEIDNLPPSEKRHQVIVQRYPIDFATRR